MYAKHEVGIKPIRMHSKRLIFNDHKGRIISYLKMVTYFLIRVVSLWRVAVCGAWLNSNSSKASFLVFTESKNCWLVAVRKKPESL